MKFIFAGAIATFVGVVPAFSECLDLSNQSAFSLTRNDPYLKVSNEMAEDGTVTETKVITRDGVTEQSTTEYWNGVIAIDRKSSRSHIHIEISEDAKSANLMAAGKEYSFPISILVNDNVVDEGSLTIQTIKKTNVSIGECKYSVMVIRKSMQRNNGTPINSESLVSVDAGVLLGNVVMSPDWKPVSGVFFDEVTVD